MSEKKYNKESQQNGEKSSWLENFMGTAVQLPLIRVDREDFLKHTFKKTKVSMEDILKYGPVEAGVGRKEIKKAADKLILQRVIFSTVVSFGAGLPGGFAMIATVPLDLVQYYAVTLRLAQEIPYLYGAEDMWDGMVMKEGAVKNQLLLYYGAMLGVEGAIAGVKILSSRMAKVILTKLPQKALTKTLWFPIIRSICRIFGVRLTKALFAKVLAKIVPVLGGIISAILTYFTMMPMAKRLARSLDRASFDYSDDECMEDLRTIMAGAKEEDGDPSNEDTSEKEEKSAFAEKSDTTQSSTAERGKVGQEDPFAKIEKLLRLKEMGAITEEEYQEKKAELFEQI